MKDVISNTKAEIEKLDFASKVITDLQHELLININNGFGPFAAAIYDDKRNLITRAFNSVVNDGCAICHAEINVIKAANKIFGTYDLAPYNLSIFVTSEPCMMCLGAILWSGIKEVYYGVPTQRVEKITGFDEGFKPDWQPEFKKRNITVYGNIEPELGEKALKEYINSGKKLYIPTR